jgi:hypothetical protein
MRSFAIIMRNRDMSKQEISVQRESNSGVLRHGISVVVLDVILTFVDMNKFNHEICIDESSASYQCCNFNDGSYNYNDTEFFEVLTVRNVNI